MRKFLNTLYVLNKDAYLSLEGENIVLLCNKAEIGRVPLHTLEGIVCFSYPLSLIHISPARGCPDGRRRRLAAPVGHPALPVSYTHLDVYKRQI